MAGNVLNLITTLQELFGDPGSEPLNCQEQDRQEPADKNIYLFIALENMWVIFKYLLVLILTQFHNNKRAGPV